MTTNSIKTFEPNDLITADDTNDNNSYLNNRISSVSTNLNAYLQSQLATINLNIEKSISELKESVQESISALQEDIAALQNKNFTPDYSKGVNISLPYTVTTIGWVRIQVQHANGSGYGQVNGQIFVHCFGGGDNRLTDISAGMAMVSPGDVVTGVAVTAATFYPMKKA